MQLKPTSPSKLLHHLIFILNWKGKKKTGCFKFALPPLSLLLFTRITKGAPNEFCLSVCLSGEAQRELAVGRRPAVPLHRRLLPQHQVPGRQRRAGASSGLVHPAQRAHPSRGRPPAGGSLTVRSPPTSSRGRRILFFFFVVVFSPCKYAFVNIVCFFCQKSHSVCALQAQVEGKMFLKDFSDSYCHAGMYKAACARFYYIYFGCRQAGQRHLSGQKTTWRDGAWKQVQLRWGWDWESSEFQHCCSSKWHFLHLGDWLGFSVGLISTEHSVGTAVSVSTGDDSTHRRKSTQEEECGRECKFTPCLPLKRLRER